MKVAVMKTKAEQAFSENFAKVADKLPGAGSVGKARREAMRSFAEVGLPHRQIEAWKYTDLRAALQDALPPAVADATKLTIADVIVALGPLASIDAHRLVIVNGCYRAELSTPDALPGLQAQPLAQSLESGADGTLPGGLGAGDGTGGDAVVMLNSAYMTDGAVLSVEADASLDKPILVAFVRAGGERQLTATRNVIDIGKGAKAQVIEAHVSVPGAAPEGQANTLSQVNVGDGAEFTHIKCALEGGQSTHLASWVSRLGAEAVYRGFWLTAGPQLARSQAFVTYAGEGGKLDLSGAFLVRGNQHADSTLVIDHAVPHCESRELFKGVLDDQGRGVFQGKVIVRPGAQKTDGKQMAQALMLSQDAEFDSKPELEIYADDVVCGHGSTSVEIDADLLFYCRARGIPEPEARALLVEAFIGEALEKIEDEHVRAAITTITAAWLRQSSMHGNGGKPRS